MEQWLSPSLLFMTLSLANFLVSFGTFLDSLRSFTRSLTFSAFVTRRTIAMLQAARHKPRWRLSLLQWLSWSHSITSTAFLPLFSWHPSSSAHNQWLLLAACRGLLAATRLLVS